ncbi:MAG: hypothetical protein ACXWW5_01970 [Actinomycetota bacterium]
MSERPAFYALAPGGWRDYWTLLHLPYTIWHLSYVAMGAALVAVIDGSRLLWSLLAFFAAVGLAAHALDELRGRPLGTSIPPWMLVAIAVVGLGGALVIGMFAIVWVSPWMIAFMVAGVFLALAYNLELFGGSFHTDLWFAVAWGGFPALTGYFAQQGELSVAAVLVAAGCVALSVAQRTLSTPVRDIRRRSVAIEGRVTWSDGHVEVVDGAWVRRAPEGALRALSFAMPLVAASMVVAAFARR